MAANGMLSTVGSKLGMLNAFTTKGVTSFRNGGQIANQITSKSVPVSSTAIDSARYDPSDNSLNITYKGGGKEYKFDAKNDLQDWVNAPSKGRITQEWRATHRMPGY